MKKKINVVHLVENLAIGGLENVLATIVLNLNTEKYNVSVWCLKKGGFYAEKLIKRRIEVKVLNISTSRNSVNIYKLYKLLKKHKIDIVHTHAYSAGTIGRISAFLAGAPIIISHNHNVYENYNRYYHYVEWLISHITDRIICVSNMVKKFTIETQKIDPKKIVTIYNGIDNVSLVPERVATNLRREFSIPVNYSVIGTVAQFSDKKGLAYLLKSASILLESRRNVVFILVGDGKIKEELKELCKNLGIEKNVIFAGERNDVPEILSLIDVFVLPSIREGMPLAILEAMSCGKPIIATNVGGVPEIVKDGVNGILVPPGDPEALYKAMNKLLNDKDKLKDMGFNSKRMYGVNFNSKTMVGKIEELYDFLLNKKMKL